MMQLYPALAIFSAATLVGAVWAHRRRTALARLGAPEHILARARRGGYRLIDTEELEVMHRENNDHLLLVDTRQEWEYRTGHIRGSIPFPIEPTGWSRWRLADALETVLGPDKDREYGLRIIRTALRALTRPVTGPTLFDPATEAAEEPSHAS